ncbi:MAG: hypothetical protein ABEH78_03450 [Haloferacaceae archaeon]
MGVVLPAAALDGYRRFSLYNSPFPAHERGCAVDLYPEGGRRSVAVPSPVAGVVRETRTVRGPSRPYAAARDHLLLLDVDPAASGLRVATTAGDAEGRGRGHGEEGGADRDLVARVLHVDPAVDPGDRVALGEPLGETVRSGFFAPWVADHLHLGLRPADRDLRRASGSLPLSVDVRVEPLPWDGTGRAVATGETYVTLDAPAHPAPGAGWVGVAGETGVAPRGSLRSSPGRPSLPGLALDGGLPHYPGGGAYAAGRRADEPRAVSLAGTPVGHTEGRTVRWRDVTVTANRHPMTGISLVVGRDGAFGVKLVSRDGHPFAVGDRIAVGIESGRR